MPVAHISPAEAARLFDSGRAIPLDVREPDEYAGGHIAGALLLPLNKIQQIGSDVLPQDKSAALVVYCRSGTRSALAVPYLEKLGYTNLCDMGGIMYWPYELEYGE